MAKLSIRNESKPDYVIVFSTLALVVFGLVMLASASSDLSRVKFGDSYYILKHQLLFGFVPGIIGFLLASKINFQRYKKIAIGLLILSIISLVLVFTPLGFSSGGADRWLKIGSLTFQPSEFLKIIFIIYLAAWFSGNEERKKSFWKGFVPFLIISGVLSFLLIIQPSTSVVAILMVAAFAVYFVSGARLSYIFGAAILGIAVLLAISFTSDYRWQRLKSYLNPTANTQTSGYHINQSLISIGSGGLTGVGYGQSSTKIHYLPEPIGDSIFAVIAEELGFIGSAAVIAAFLVLVMRGFILARKTGDMFARLLLVGFSVLIGFQAFVNIGAISGLLPLTGTPLPYISYGGTALAVYMTISGIMINISKYI